jgi:hypothetical protein
MPNSHGMCPAATDDRGRDVLPADDPLSVVSRVQCHCVQDYRTLLSRGREAESYAADAAWNCGLITYTQSAAKPDGVRRAIEYVRMALRCTWSRARALNALPNSSNGSPDSMR